MAPHHLFDLPNETKLNILSRLPYKEIQRARVISRHIRDLIDDDTNRTILLKSTAPIQVLAIIEAHENVFKIDPQKDDLLEFVKYFFHQRQHVHHTGTQQEREGCLSRTYDAIASLWARGANVFFRPNVQLDVRNLVCKLVQLHNSHAVKIRGNSTPTKEAFIIYALQGHHFAAAALYGPRELLKWYDRLTDPTGTYLAFNERHNVRPAFFHRRGKFFLTPGEVSGLRLPAIPMPEFFGYAMKNAKAFKFVRKRRRQPGIVLTERMRRELLKDVVLCLWDERQL